MIESATDVAWPQLMERLRTFIARRVAAPDVEDVLQVALLRVQRGLPGLRDGQHLGPWVYQVTRSALVDHFRTDRRVETLEPTEEDIVDNTAGAGPDDADGLRPELLACLATFVAELPSPYREAITLTELEGLTQKQAAQMLGVSVSGMKSRVQRGRARLRQMFEACCEFAQDARGKVMACEPRAAPPLGPSCADGASGLADRPDRPALAEPRVSRPGSAGLEP